MNESDSQRLKVIEDMLTALLKSQNHIHWIGGYVYGKTKGGDPFVILYPAAEYLQEKACRVYPQEFKKLPQFIPTQNVQGKTRGNPNKGEARELGIYNECPMFQVITYDGKDTPMGNEKRFGKVLRVTNKMPGGRANNSPSPEAEPEPEASPAAPVPQSRPLSQDEQTHYRNEARTATDDFMFVTAVQKLYPKYTVKGLETIRGRVCAEPITADNAPRQYEAMVKYISRRAELERIGDTRAAHNTAAVEAAAHYKQGANQ
jgi:hypothetical protein